MSIRVKCNDNIIMIHKIVVILKSFNLQIWVIYKTQYLQKFNGNNTKVLCTKYYLGTYTYTMHLRKFPTGYILSIVIILLLKANDKGFYFSSIILHKKLCKKFELPLFIIICTYLFIVQSNNSRYNSIKMNKVVIL